eukprot:2062214-Ditylum_brightwellii.AAC.1
MPKEIFSAGKEYNKQFIITSVHDQICDDNQLKMRCIKTFMKGNCHKQDNDHMQQYVMRRLAGYTRQGLELQYLILCMRMRNNGESFTVGA